MRMSQLFTKTTKSAPADAETANAKFLQQAGFVHQEMAGVYSWLPLGLRVLRKVETIIRQEMDAIGGQEVLLTALQPKENWLTTKRWDDVDVLFKLNSQTGKEYALGPTAEDIVTPLVQSFTRSYKDLPLAVYQIQTKFRDELRAKSGVLRGREFLMKDMYSFHADRESFAEFYEKAKQAYLRVYERCGVSAKVTESSGGSFTKNPSHEFQIETAAGEDSLILCRACTFAQNTEIATKQAGEACPCCGAILVSSKGIEVGNIFDLSSRFTDAFGFTVTGEDGEKKTVHMGCYGIGVSRLVGAIVEACHDERGMIWPKSVAPAQVQLVMLNAKDAEAQDRVLEAAEELQEKLQKAGIEVLWDERSASVGEKLADADLIGLPLRILISEKSLKEGSIEWKARTEAEAHLVKLEDVLEQVQAFLAE